MRKRCGRCCSAARTGETYNIGGHNEWANIRIVELICDMIDEFAPQAGGNSRKLMTFVKDRPGHDRRYAIDADEDSEANSAGCPRTSLSKASAKRSDGIWTIRSG